MRDFKAISLDLVKSLGLKYEPVGVTLYRETDPLPAGIPFTPENLKSYCQALVLAGEGRTLLLSREQMGCKLGTSVLGFETEMEGYLDDGVLEKYGVGLVRPRGGLGGHHPRARLPGGAGKPGPPSSRRCPPLRSLPQVVVLHRRQRAGHVAARTR